MSKGFSMTTWVLLLLAIFCEVSGTTFMKLSDGFQKTAPSVLMFLFYALSFVGLALAIRRIDIGVAYAIWSGLGTALIAVIGVLYFSEPVNALKIVSTGLIILGVMGLHLSGFSH